jgi:hypothetical protein
MHTYTIAPTLPPLASVLVRWDLALYQPDVKYQVRDRYLPSRSKVLDITEHSYVVFG